MPDARILIVEDEIVIVRGLEQALEKFGYTVCDFTFSGEEAPHLVQREKPDLVLVDVFLRGKIDGFELVREVTSRFEIPVIYITAYSNREVLERAKLTVADDGVGLRPEVDINRLKSLGLRLVSDLALYQLEGEMNVLREGGTTVRVRFREREKVGSADRL